MPFNLKLQKRTPIIIGIWGFVLICAIVTLCYLNQRSLQLIRHIELFPTSDYMKAQLLYDEADRNFKAIMSKIEKINSQSSKQELLSDNDELVSKTLELYLTALQIDPRAEFDISKQPIYERIAQIYDGCGVGYKRYEYMARALACDGNFKLAEVYAGTAASAYPKNPDNWKLLAEIYIEQKQYTYAGTVISQAQKAGLPQWAVLLLNAKLNYQCGNLQQAKEYLIESLHLDPNQNVTRSQMTDTLEKMEEYRAALTMLEDGIGHGVESSVVLLSRLGALSMRLNEFDKAIKYYTMSIQLNPDNADLHWGLAQALQKTGAPQYKIDDHKQTAIRYNPEYEFKTLDK